MSPVRALTAIECGPKLSVAKQVAAPFVTMTPLQIVFEPAAISTNVAVTPFPPTGACATPVNLAVNTAGWPYTKMLAVEVTFTGAVATPMARIIVDADDGR